MPGTLIIKPLSGKLTRDVDTFGKMVSINFVKIKDPYCMITIGTQKYRTKTHEDGGKSPAWNESFIHRVN